MTETSENDNNFLIIENPSGMQFKIYYDNIHADCLDAVIKTMMSAKLPAEMMCNVVCGLVEATLKANSSPKNRYILCFSSFPDDQLKDYLATKFKCFSVEDTAGSAGNNIFFISNSMENHESIALNDVANLLQHPNIRIFHNTEDVLKYVNEDTDKLSLFDLILVIPCQDKLSDEEKRFLGYITRHVSQRKIYILCTNKEQCVQQISYFSQEIVSKNASNWISKHITKDFDLLNPYTSLEDVFDCFYYTYQNDKMPVISPIYKKNLQKMLYYVSNWENILYPEMPQYIATVGNIRPMFENDICKSLVETKTVAVNYPYWDKKSSTYILDNNQCKNGNNGYSVSGFAERMIQMSKDCKAISSDPRGKVWNEFKNQQSGYTKIANYVQLNFSERHGFLLRSIYSHLCEINHNNNNSTGFDHYFLLTVIYSTMEFLSWLSCDILSKSNCLIKTK